MILAVRKDSSAQLNRLSLRKRFNGLPLACVDTALYNGANFSLYLYLKRLYVPAYFFLLILFFVYNGANFSIYLFLKRLCVPAPSVLHFSGAPRPVAPARQ